jgi:hypothetical protein
VPDINTGTFSAGDISWKHPDRFLRRIMMGYIFDTFTIAGIISSICTICVVLILLDCCKIKNSLRAKIKGGQASD